MPRIPELVSAGNGGNAIGPARMAQRKNRVTQDRMRRAANDHENAEAAAAGVSEKEFFAGEKKKLKRNMDTQDVIDGLVATSRSEVANVEKMVIDLTSSLQKSPGKKKKDNEEQINRLIIQYQQQIKNNNEIGLSSEEELESIKKLKAQRLQL